MKTLTLKLGEKLYTSGKVTAWMARESMMLNRELIEFSKAAHQMQGETGTVETAEKLYSEMQGFLDRKVNLICDAFSGKFTADELMKELSEDEIEGFISQIAFGVRGATEKN